LKPTGLTGWYSLRARIVNYNGAIAKNRGALGVEMRQALMLQLTRVKNQARILPEAQLELDVITSIGAVGDRPAGAAGRKAALQAFDKVLRKIERHLLQCSRRSYQSWIKEQLGAGAGALHKLSTSWGQPLKVLSPERDAAGQILVEPMAIAAAKAARWGELWQVGTEPVWTAWWARLRERANAQERVEIEVEDVVSAMKVFRTKIGLGVDQVNPKWWLDLPEGGHRDLVLLLETIEERLAWPTPMLQNLVALLHKGAQADRPITPTQSLYRLWGSVRKCQVGRWSRERAGHWDRAVAGSSPLRAALLRQVKLELASAQGLSRCELLWGINNF
jgi:hypothetical protein